MRRWIAPKLLVFFLATSSTLLADDSAAPRLAKLRLTLVDEATGKTLPHGWASLFPPGSRSSKEEIRPERQPDGSLKFLAPPGRYAIVWAQQRAASLEGLQYDMDGNEPKVRLITVQPKELTLKLRSRPLTSEEIEQRAPITAHGCVLDPQGQPIVGAIVRVATGWGTLLGGGHTTTDARGEYVLRFGPGIMIFDSESQFQAAIFSCDLEGYVEQSRSRPFKYMAYVPSLGEGIGDVDADEVVVRGMPNRLDFVLSPAAEIAVTVVDENGDLLTDQRVALSSPEDFPNASKVAAPRGEKDDRANELKWHALPKHPWRFSLGESRSTTFMLPSPDKYAAKLRYRADGPQDIALLEIVEVRDATGTAIDISPVTDDPFAHAPIEGKLRERALELLHGIRQANKLWLNGPPAELGTFSYRFQFDVGDRHKDDVTVKPGERGHGVHQGVSYWSAVHVLTKDPSRVAIRALKEEPDKITIAYTLREPIRQAMGTGVTGRWSGYFSRNVRNATLVVDSKKLTPIESYDDEVREEFDEILEVKPGQYVPRRIKIYRNGHCDYDWAFAWHDPGLWLFRESRIPEDGTTNAHVEHVEINGPKP